MFHGVGKKVPRCLSSFSTEFPSGSQCLGIYEPETANRHKGRRLNRAQYLGSFSPTRRGQEPGTRVAMGAAHLRATQPQGRGPWARAWEDFFTRVDGVDVIVMRTP
jgi:hypothetical protein